MRTVLQHNDAPNVLPLKSINQSPLVRNQLAIEHLATDLQVQGPKNRFVATSIHWREDIPITRRCHQSLPRWSKYSYGKL
jgi:hypothetical protein